MVTTIGYIGVYVGIMEESMETSISYIVGVLLAAASLSERGFLSMSNPKYTHTSSIYPL